MSRVSIEQDWQPLDKVLQGLADFAPLDSALDASRRQVDDAATKARQLPESASAIQPDVTVATLRDCTAQVRQRLPLVKRVERALRGEVWVMQWTVRSWRLWIGQRRAWLGMATVARSVLALAWRLVQPAIRGWRGLLGRMWGEGTPKEDEGRA
jgi:hypothetical protein